MVTPSDDYADSFVADFNYRAAQTARWSRVRNHKSREELLELGVHLSFSHIESDWLMAAHPMETKKLREFLVFVDWAQQRLTDLYNIGTDFPVAHIYKFLGTTPRKYTEIEQLWIEALDVYNNLGGNPGRWPCRPGTKLSKVGLETSDSPVWNSSLVAEFWGSAATFDNTYISGVLNHPAIAKIRTKIKANSSIWISVVDGNLQLFMPIHL